MKYDAVAAGATRPSVVKCFDIPLAFIPVVIAPPLVAAWVTFNPFWMPVGCYGLTLAVRRLFKKDHNRLRILWLSFLSGAMFADRSKRGGHTVDPLSNGSAPHHAR